MRTIPIIGEPSASEMGRDRRDRSASSTKGAPRAPASSRHATAGDRQGNGSSGGDGKPRSPGALSRRRGGSRATNNRSGPPSPGRARRFGFGAGSGPRATGSGRETDALANPLADPATTGDGIGWIESVIPLRSRLHYRIFRRGDRSDYLEVYSKSGTWIGPAPATTADDRRGLARNERSCLRIVIDLDDSVDRNPRAIVEWVASFGGMRRAALPPEIPRRSS